MYVLFLRLCCLALLCTTLGLNAPAAEAAGGMTIVIGTSGEIAEALRGPDGLLRALHDMPKGLGRPDLELIILARALQLGGLEAKFRFEIFPNYSRALEEAKLGNVHMPQQTAWREDIDTQSFFSSDAVIRNGEFVVLFYTRPGNHKTLEATTLERLSQCIATVDSNWIKDVDLLNRLGVTQREYAGTMASMERLVTSGRADFLTQPPNNTPGMELPTPHGLLIPVPGVVGVLNGSRHFVISRKAPHAKAIHDALQHGLRQMRREGEIHDILARGGFFNANVENWVVLP